MEQFLYGGHSDVGYKRSINEDYVSIIELDDNTLFAVIADGAGSKTSTLQPASIATREVNAIVKRLFEQDSDLFRVNSELFMTEAMLTANRVLGAFKIANEELYCGFGVSMTCCLLGKDNAITFTHTGNTRLYLIRVNSRDGGISSKQITQDQTKGKRLVNEGLITLEQYHTHPDRLIITGGLGMAAEPVIQSYKGRIKENDFILMSTDGIHYAVRPEAMAELVIRSENCDDANQALLEAAKSQQYTDNMSSIVIFNRELPI